LTYDDASPGRIKLKNGYMPPESKESQEVAAQLDIGDCFRLINRVGTDPLKLPIEYATIRVVALAPNVIDHILVQFHLEAHARISSLRKATLWSHRKVFKVEPAAIRASQRSSPLDSTAGVSAYSIISNRVYIRFEICQPCFRQEG
jgi:hypothetical protein